MIRTYFDGQKPLENTQLSDSTSDNGEYISRQDILDELTRLRGEVERLKAFIGADESQMRGIMEIGQELINQGRRAETAEARVKELEKAVVRTSIDNDQCFGILQGTEAKLKEAQAQLAELRARVRPSVEEIGRELARVCKTTVTTDSIGRTLAFANLSDMAQAIHDILPPVPKVLTVEELEDIEEMNQLVHHDDIPILSKAIHKAMGGEE